MSIIPAGKRKDQVRQGALRNQSILDSELFKKFGQGASALIDDPAQKQRQRPSDDLQQTMLDGGLDHDGMADQMEHQVDPFDQTPPSAQGVQPAGGGSPASRFLGPDPDGQQADPNQLWQAERQKIRAFIGNDFGMKLKQGTDGAFTVALTPPGNVPVQDPTGFMDALLQAIGGASINEESTPAVSDAGGVLTLTYRPSGAGPQKIHPRGKGRR
ncbi:MAG: hypothetical protein ACXAC5_03235 [Promethearchaeota archaeon]|jgi:hypothetical protein